MDSFPAVRARHLHQWLVLVDRSEEPWRTRFFDAIPADVRAAIDGASPLTWVPVDLHVALAEVLKSTFGIARAHEYYRRAFASNLDSPLLGGLVTTGIRVLGLTPKAFVRWGHKGWEMSFRDCGDITGELLGPARARLTYLALPPVCAASDAWIDSALGTVYGMYDVTHVDGVARLDKRERASGRIVVELEWTERAG